MGGMTATAYEPTGTNAARPLKPTYEGPVRHFLNQSAAVKATSTANEDVGIPVHPGFTVATTGAAVNGIEVAGGAGDINITVDGAISASNTGVAASSTSADINVGEVGAVAHTTRGVDIPSTSGNIPTEDLTVVGGIRTSTVLIVGGCVVFIVLIGGIAWIRTLIGP
jgi:hypothetical protein